MQPKASLVTLMPVFPNLLKTNFGPAACLGMAGFCPHGSEGRQSQPALEKSASG